MALSLSRSVHVIDSHTAGHPTRVILGGLPPLQGKTVKERRDDFRARYDWLRPMLLQEPRGHAAMVCAVVTPSSEADFGAFYISSYVYLDMCGHGTIGLAKTLVATGQVDPVQGPGRFSLETPAGIVGVDVVCERGAVTGIRIANVPCHVVERALQVDVPDHGPIRVDIAYGGGTFAIVDAAALGWKIEPDNTSELCRRGTAIKEAVNAMWSRDTAAGGGARVGSILFYEDLGRDHARHLVVLERNKFDRSPCGTGTSARLALLHDQGRLAPGVAFTAEGVLGTRFECRIESISRDAETVRVHPTILGNAHITAFSNLVVEEGDPLAAGFLCR